MSNYFMHRLDPIDVDTSSVSYLEEQLTHQIRLATARLNISDVEDDDRDNIWSDNIGNDDDDNEYDSDHLATDWEAVNIHLHINLFDYLTPT